MSVLPRFLSLLLLAPAFLAQPAQAETYYEGDQLPPAGLALFSASDFYGEVREAFDPFLTLHDLAFNDRARSVAVLAGQWELCEHVNFTGRCVFITEDVADLGWFGLGGRITSIRPIYEYTLAQHGLMFTRDSYGRIRYAHDESYGYGSWKYGYSTSWRVSISHYGHSPDYWRYGYYDPVWGYDPYGFAWTHHGRRLYPATVVAIHPRPRVLNRYWRKTRDRDWHPGPGYRPRDGDRRWPHDDDRSYRGRPAEEGFVPPDLDGGVLPDRPRSEPPGSGRRWGSDDPRTGDDRRDRRLDGRGRDRGDRALSPVTPPPVTTAPGPGRPDFGGRTGGGRTDAPREVPREVPRDGGSGRGPGRGEGGFRPNPPAPGFGAPPVQAPPTAVAPPPAPPRARIGGDSARQADRGRRVPD